MKHKPRYIKRYRIRDTQGHNEAQLCLDCTLPTCDQSNPLCPLKSRRRAHREQLPNPHQIPD